MNYEDQKKMNRIAEKPELFSDEELYLAMNYLGSLVKSRIPAELVRRLHDVKKDNVRLQTNSVFHVHELRRAKTEIVMQVRVLFLAMFCLVMSFVLHSLFPELAAIAVVLPAILTGVVALFLASRFAEFS